MADWPLLGGPKYTEWGAHLEGLEVLDDGEVWEGLASREVLLKLGQLRLHQRLERLQLLLRLIRTALLHTNGSKIGHRLPELVNC